MKSTYSLPTVTDLEHGDHLCCFYETEEEHRAVLTPFMRHGLERGEKVLYIADVRNTETILGYLKDDGLEVQPYLTRGQLSILGVDEAYMRDGVFDPDGMISLLRTETERALDEGYRALRVTGEATWAFRGLRGSERLIEYEAKLNDFFPGSKCLAICQYDMRHFDPALLLYVLATHPIAVIGTEIFDNFYYMPAKDLVGPDPAVARLRNWQKNLAERKQAQEALSQSEHRYRSLVENTLDGYFILEFPSGRFLFVNQRICELFGYTKQEALGLSVWDVIVPEEHGILKERFEARIRGEKLNPERYIYKAVRKDGSTFLAEVSASGIISQGKPVVQGVIRDVTEQKRLEQQLQHAQKMEAVGTLTSGIAHDFNNLLQAVHGYAELILLGKDKDEPAYRELKEIIRAAKRGAELIQQLLTFGRKVETKRRSLDLNHEVEQVRSLLERTIPKMIDIKVHLVENLRTVNADPSQIEQVLMNLALNAKDAMREGGGLTIETANVTLDDEYCKTHLGARPGDYVLLTISDTGHGMDRETLEHIFDPFYSTKDVGKGTGLGLAMVYGTVKSHDGYITCSSERGEGTTFKIYLPVIEQEAEMVEVKEAEVPLKGGSETILLVDDEEHILDLGKQILAEFGYTVLTAADGEGALELYRKRKDRINLVILDLLMPGMGGRKCLEELVRIDPQARVVIASGYYPANGRTRRTMEGAARGYITKPYNLRKMLKVVRNVLGQY